jgi:trehalose-6-phosphate synthase
MKFRFTYKKRIIFDQHELAGFYRDADVGLVTPLRDGMNLVAKEFVACRLDSLNIFTIVFLI